MYSIPRKISSGLMLLSALVPIALYASSHREAPITALDQKADITDWYAFVSPERPDRVILIMNVDPFLEPGNGPNYFPFDPGIRYDLNVDNNRDGVPDITFQFRFETEIRAPGVFTGYVGGLLGIPAITALDGAGSEGLNLRQKYTVNMVRGASSSSSGTGASTGTTTGTATGTSTDIGQGKTLYAVPANVGPRTMPNYEALRAQGTYQLNNGIRVFAGTVADPFFIDLGAAFDSLNFRNGADGGVLSPYHDSDSTRNWAPNTLAGFDVNSLVVEVPISMLTEDNQAHPASEKEAVIGTWGATYRQNIQVLRPDPTSTTPTTDFVQVQRLGNPLINELIIGTGSKDKFSTDQPKNDSQFANFVLDPLLAKIFDSIGIPVPRAPRTDLLPLVQYMAPICPGCADSDRGPVADMLRLNTGISPTPATGVNRLGALAGDLGGFPNGRRLTDDVVDIAARAVAGALAGSQYGARIGDGVQFPAVPPSDKFPFVAPAYSGRNSSHAGPGQSGCGVAGADVCPVQ